jgi:integrase-like protein
VPQKQPKRTGLWFADCSCVRRRPEYPNHVWAYDFVMDRTWDGRPLKMLTVTDESTRECLAIEVRRRLRATDVQEVLGELFLARGCPAHMRSDNGLNSSPIRCDDGLLSLTCHPCSLNQGAPGKMDMWNRSTASFDTTTSTGSSFTHCLRLVCVLNVGGGTTIRTGLTVRWDIGHRPQKEPRRDRSLLRHHSLKEWPNRWGEVTPT